MAPILKCKICAREIPRREIFLGQGRELGETTCICPNCVAEYGSGPAAAAAQAGVPTRHLLSMPAAVLVSLAVGFWAGSTFTMKTHQKISSDLDMLQDLAGEVDLDDLQEMYRDAIDSGEMQKLQSMAEGVLSGLEPSQRQQVEEAVDEFRGMLDAPAQVDD